MDFALGFWHSLTEAQASLIGSIATILSALIVALLGPLMFRNTVKGIEEARDKAREAAESIQIKFQELNEQFSSITESLATVQNRVEDVVMAEQESYSSQSDQPGEQRREELKSIWNELRDLAEQRAASPDIHGKTRSKYARISRRDYMDLIRAMNNDRNLVGSLEDWTRAHELWRKFLKRSSTAPTLGDLELMRAYRERLKAVYRSHVRD